MIVDLLDDGSGSVSCIVIDKILDHCHHLFN